MARPRVVQESAPTSVLVCPPAFYTIPDVKNPHMHLDVQPIPEKAWSQWTAIRNLYEASDLKVYEMEPDVMLDDMVFTANGGWVHNNPDNGNSEIVLSNFLYKIRQFEKPHFRRWAERLGLTVFELPEDILFEGQGDVITVNNAYLFGYGFRSSPEAREYTARMLKLQKPTLPLHLVNPDFYHLDTCCMSLRGTSTEGLVYYPGAFDGESLQHLRDLNAERLEIPQALADCFVCNSVFVGNKLFLNVPFEDYNPNSLQMSASFEVMESNKDPRYIEMVAHEKGYRRLIKFLWELGYEVIPVYTSEFKKSGAGNRCCTLFLN